MAQNEQRGGVGMGAPQTDFSPDRGFGGQNAFPRVSSDNWWTFGDPKGLYYEVEFQFAVNSSVFWLKRKIHP